MLEKELAEVLSRHFPECEVDVTEQGGHYNISVIGPDFEGLSPVKRQQAVYAPLADYIADGRVHAVNIKAATA